ncbi:Uncharacterised protein [Amycolatopsis camponoti]|uniref:Uncharacterized protein n=1 Tax=Amycolatopsis camponoti TaxID=2606593 RepID=A0A6I8LJ74_9PSEU|nr:Uncharacterised protein [Amycolatopsis camponoti]
MINFADRLPRGAWKPGTVTVRGSRRLSPGRRAQVDLVAVSDHAASRTGAPAKT